MLQYRAVTTLLANRILEYKYSDCEDALLIGKIRYGAALSVDYD